MTEDNNGDIEVFHQSNNHENWQRVLHEDDFKDFDPDDFTAIKLILSLVEDELTDGLINWVMNAYRNAQQKDNPILRNFLMEHKGFKIMFNKEF